MSLLTQIHALADDDRVELRQKVGGCWQIHSYPAKELKAIAGSPIDKHKPNENWERYGQFMSGNYYMNGEDQVGVPFDIAVPVANARPTLIPEPDPNTPPDFNS